MDPYNPLRVDTERRDEHDLLNDVRHDVRHDVRSDPRNDLRNDVNVGNTSLYGEHVAAQPFNSPSNGWPESPANFVNGVPKDGKPRQVNRYRRMHSSPTDAGWAQRKYGMPAKDGSSSARLDSRLGAKRPSE